MKYILILGLIGSSLVASAAVQPVAKKAGPAAVSKKKLSKDISFNGSQVDGKYLSAGESVAEIEGDKDMGALIGIRKNFRDRLKTETTRLQAQTSQSATSGKGQ